VGKLGSRTPAVQGTAQPLGYSNMGGGRTTIYSHACVGMGHHGEGLGEGVAGAAKHICALGTVMRDGAG